MEIGRNERNYIIHVSAVYAFFNDVLLYISSNLMMTEVTAPCPGRRALPACETGQGTGRDPAGADREEERGAGDVAGAEPEPGPRGEEGDQEPASLLPRPGLHPGHIHLRHLVHRGGGDRVESGRGDGQGDLGTGPECLRRALPEAETGQGTGRDPAGADMEEERGAAMWRPPSRSRAL